MKKGTAAVDSQARSVGNFGARIDEKGRIYQEFDTVPGRKYYVSGRVRVDREIIKPTWGGLVIWVLDDTGNVVGSSKYITRSNCPKGSWKPLRFSFRAGTAKTGFVFRKFSDGQFVAAADDFVVSRFPILQ